MKIEQLSGQYAKMYDSTIKVVNPENLAVIGGNYHGCDKRNL